MAQPDMIAAVQGGQVDAGMEVEALGHERAGGRPQGAGSPGSYALPGQLFTGWVASKGIHRAEPEHDRGIRAALSKAADEIQASVEGDGTLARAEVKKNTKLDPAVVDKMTLPTFSSKPITPADIQGNLDALKQFGQLESPVNAADLIGSAQ